MLLSPFCKRGRTDLLLSFEYELDVVPLKSVAHQVLKCLDVHEGLTLVIVGPAGIDGSVADFRLKGGGLPQLDRIDRLYVVMAVDEYGLQRGIDDLVGIDYWMSGGVEHLGSFRTGFPEQFGEPAGAAVHVILVLRVRADGRYPEQVK